MNDALCKAADRLQVLVKEFNPSQPRDDDGRWSDGGGGGLSRIKTSLLTALGITAAVTAAGAAVGAAAGAAAFGAAAVGTIAVAGAVSGLKVGEVLGALYVVGTVISVLGESGDSAVRRALPADGQKKVVPVETPLAVEIEQRLRAMTPAERIAFVAAVVKGLTDAQAEAVLAALAEGKSRPATMEGVAAQLDVLLKEFKPSQARDGHGRWTSEGGGEDGGNPRPTRSERVARVVRGMRQISLAFDEASNVIGSAAAATALIAAAARTFRSLKARTDTSDPVAVAQAIMRGLSDADQARLIAAFADELAALAGDAVPPNLKAHGLATARIEYKFVAGGKPGDFQGYASVFGNVDQVGDIVRPGAFAKSLAKWRGRGRWMPMYANHGTRLDSEPLPIGVWRNVEEDARGLKVAGAISGMETDFGRRIYSLVRDDALSGMSIAYTVPKGGQGAPPAGSGAKRELIEVDIVEISLVDDPAEMLARVEQLKARALSPIEDFARRLRDGEPPGIKEFEDILREAGVPRSMAVRIASVGYAKAFRSESEGTEATIESKTLAGIGHAIGALHMLAK